MHCCLLNQTTQSQQMQAVRVPLIILVVTIQSIHSQTKRIDNLMLANRQDNINTARCVLGMSAKYFVEKKALSGSIVIININSYASTTQKTLLETIHSGSKFSVMVKDSAIPHKNASHFPEKAKNYMLILENKEELKRNIHQLNKLPTWNPHAKAVVFIELNPYEELDKLVKQLIDELRNYKLLNTIVIVNFPERLEVKAFTWKPYSDTNCGGPCDAIHLLDTCKNGNVTEVQAAVDIFPSNMNLCPLTVYTVVSEPYVMPPIRMKDDSIYDDEYIFDLGIEVNMMKIIAEFTNMTLVIRMSNKSEDWGNIEPDGTATGLFSKLRNDEVDIIIGNMEVNRVIRKWFDPSSTYMQDEITWCVPKAGAASTWSNLITIFKPSTWLTTFAAIIFMSSIFHLFLYSEKANLTMWPTNSILMTYGMILGWGALFHPKKISFRIIILTWLLFSININTAYQSFLRSFLIHPKYMKQISSDCEIAQEKFLTGGKPTMKNYFEGSDPIAKYIYDNYEGCDTLNGCLKKVGFEKNFAVATSRRQAEYLGQRLKRGSTLIYCFDERNVIYKYGVVILSRKYFPIISRFNVIMRKVSENGLIWKWNSEVFLHQVTAGDTNDMVPLGLEHMFGAILLLIVGYVVCIFVFVSELFVNAVVKYVNGTCIHGIPFSL